jgi:hypothetical protein
MASVGDAAPPGDRATAAGAQASASDSNAIATGRNTGKRLPMKANSYLS